MQRHFKPIPAFAALLAVGMLAVGCSGKSSDVEASSLEQRRSTTIEPTDTTIGFDGTTVVPTTTIPTTDEEAVVEAYENFLHAWEMATNPPDPDHPALAKYIGGRELEVVRNAIEEIRRQEIILTRPKNSVSGFTIEGKEVQGNSAKLTVCLIDDGLQIHEPTGTILNDLVGSSRITVILERRDSGWVVTENNYQFTVAGAGGCDG